MKKDQIEVLIAVVAAVVAEVVAAVVAVVVVVRITVEEAFLKDNNGNGVEDVGEHIGVVVVAVPGILLVAGAADEGPGLELLHRRYLVV